MRTESHTEAGARGHGLRVLIVEDDPIGRDIMSNLLARSGYEPIRAGTVEQALRLAKESPPEVLVIDWLLPDGSGLEVAEQVRALSPATAVIFLSGFSCEELRAEACHLRPAAILSKPVTSDNLLEAVEHAVGAGAH